MFTFIFSIFVVLKSLNSNSRISRLILYKKEMRGTSNTIFCISIPMVLANIDISPDLSVYPRYKLAFTVITGKKSLIAQVLLVNKI